MGHLFVFVVAWLAFIAATLGVGLLFIPVYWMLVFKQPGPSQRVERAQQKMASTLIDGERPLFSALQMRLGALTNRRLLIGITSSRIILISRSLFGGFTMKDYQWKDLRDAKLSENVFPDYFGSKLVFVVSGGYPLMIDSIQSEQASRIYKEAQKQEQEWEEKRRVRALEEARAASGGVSLNTGSGGGPDVLGEIQKAKQMLDSGVISDAEFSEIKAKLLSRGSF